MRKGFAPIISVLLITLIFLLGIYIFRPKLIENMVTRMFLKEVPPTEYSNSSQTGSPSTSEAQPVPTSSIKMDDVLYTSPTTLPSPTPTSYQDQIVPTTPQTYDEEPTNGKKPPFVGG